MIGYKITAKNHKMNYVRIYDGWFEGSPKLESKAKEAAAKQILKQMMKQGAQFVVGGPAGAVVKVADIVSKPLQGLGTAAGQLIAENLMKINRARAEQGLIVSDIVVTITGDFEGTYRINDSDDLADLPKLLALIPEKNTTDQFMGESVLESAFWAHVNFARHIYNFGNWNVGRQSVYDLELNIDI